MTRSIAAVPTRTDDRPAQGGRSREELANRLLKGSVRKSYAPVVDIDWDAPIEPDMFPPAMLQEMLGREYFVRVQPPLDLATAL